MTKYVLKAIRIRKVENRCSRKKKYKNFQISKYVCYYLIWTMPYGIDIKCPLGEHALGTSCQPGTLGKCGKSD